MNYTDTVNLLKELCDTLITKGKNITYNEELGSNGHYFTVFEQRGFVICVAENNLVNVGSKKSTIEYKFYITDPLTQTKFHSDYRKCTLDKVTKVNLVNLINYVFKD